VGLKNLWFETMPVKRLKRTRRGTVTRRRRLGPTRSLTDMNKVVAFRLVDNSSTSLLYASSASGVLAGYHNADPSGGGTWTSAEWSSITALYSQVRLISFCLSFAPCPLEDTKLSGTTAGSTIVVSSVLSTIGGAATARSQVWDNADAKVYNLLANQGKTPFKHYLRPKGTLQWAVVTTPNPGSYAGCPGGIQWYGDNFPDSSSIMTVYIEGIYEFRSRI